MDRFVFEKVSIVVNYGEEEAKVSSILICLSIGNGVWIWYHAVVWRLAS